MITPEYLNRIMHTVEDSLENLNESLVKRIARRIMDTFTEKGNNLFIPSTISDMRKLIQNGMLYEDVEQAIEKALPSIQKEVKQAFLESASEICRQNLDVAKKIVISEHLASVEVPEYEQVGIVQSAEQLHMTPHEIRLLEQAYRRTIGEIKNYTRTTANLANLDYIKACNDAWMKTQSGISIGEAVADAIKEVSDKGISVVTYNSGHVDKIDVAIARAVRTGVNQANAEIVLQRCAEMGVGYVKVSEHLGARVTKVDDYTNHSWWQGKVYSIDWSLPEFNDFKPTVQDYEKFGWLKRMRDELQSRKYHKKYPDFVQTCGYGDVQGIVGANCRHSFYPFYPGIQLDEPSNINKVDNDKRYALDQKQRAMERAIRKTKRRLASFKQDKEKFAKQIKQNRDLLQRQSDAYMDFCKSNGLKPRNMALKV